MICNFDKSTTSNTTLFLKPYLKTSIFVGIKRIILVNSSRANIKIKTEEIIFINISEFRKMNAGYERMFGRHRPARTTVQVAALPGPEMKVEIDVIAYVP